jgi:ribosomal protein S12 methylthiotransferase
MPDQVPDAVRRERLERLLDVQRTITLERNESWVGREVPALIDARVGADAEDGAAGRGAVARTRGQALEVDGVVYLADARGARPGDVVRVRITSALDDDLTGEIVAHG